MTRDQINPKQQWKTAPLWTVALPSLVSGDRGLAISTRLSDGSRLRAALGINATKLPPPLDTQWLPNYLQVRRNAKEARKRVVLVVARKISPDFVVGTSYFTTTRYLLTLRYFLFLLWPHICSFSQIE